MLFLASQARVDSFPGLPTIDYATVIIYFSGVLALASISTVVQMTPFRFEPPARILDRRDLRLLCFHLR